MKAFDADSLRPRLAAHRALEENCEVIDLPGSLKLEQLAGCDANAEVDFASLLAAGQVTKKKYDVVKVVGSAGDVSVPAGLTVKAHAFTGSARAAIEGAGGKCVELSKTTQEPVEA